MNLRNLFITCFFSLFFACTHMPLQSVIQMRSFEPRTSDLSQLRAIVKIPNAIDINSVNTVYEVSARSGNHLLTHSSVLREFDTGTKETELMTKIAQDGYSLRAYRLSPSDISAIDNLRDQLETWKAAGEENVGHLAFTVEDFCYLDINNEEKLTGDLWIHTEETQKYILFLKNLDLSIKSFEENSMKDRSYIQCD